MAPGTWHLAPGTWHLAHGTWHMAHGTWHLAPGTWHLAHGPAPVPVQGRGVPSRYRMSLTKSSCTPR
jgi:hypothetical protein